MNAEELKIRTQQYAIRIIRLCHHLQTIREIRHICDQLFRSGTSVGANYRAACRARSTAEFIAKLGIVLEEADESLYWLELLVELKVIRTERLSPLMDESNELISIFVTSLNTAKGT